MPPRPRRLPATELHRLATVRRRAAAAAEDLATGTDIDTTDHLARIAWLSAILGDHHPLVHDAIVTARNATAQPPWSAIAAALGESEDDGNKVADRIRKRNS